MSRNTRAYLFHGLNLKIRAEEAVLAALDSRLKPFPHGNPDCSSDLEFDFQRTSEPSAYAINKPSGCGRSVLDVGRGEVAYFDDSKHLYIDFAGHGRALCDTKAGRVRVSYPQSEENDPWLLSHPLFTIALSELLKSHGFYMVHSGGLAVNNKALLIAGQSGAGKTTLTLALLRAGFGFLADDTVFLTSSEKPGPEALRVMAFPDEIDVAANTARFFPELNNLHQGKPTGGRPKKPICAAAVYGAKPVWQCTPEVIVFPQPSQNNQSTISDMTKGEALMQLVCNVLRTDARSSQSHLDALATLVKQSRCYRLQTGRDFDTLPGMLRSLVEK